MPLVEMITDVGIDKVLMEKGTENMNKILEVKNLYKDYDNVRILDNVSLAVDKGEFVVVMGQSGCGKSTLLYSISGMESAFKGEVFLDGKEVSKLSEKDISRLRLEKMGFIFQKPNLLRNMSIEENISFPGMELKEKDKKQVKAKAVELMQKVGIGKIAKSDIKKVSGGELQRAAICRALINNPQIIFADEPTGALNSSTTTEIMDIFNKINLENATIMMVTHDAKVAARADRIIYLEDGSVKSQLIIGKYVKEDKEKREEKVAEWLKTQGF